MDKIKWEQLANQQYYSRFRPIFRTITFAAPTATLTNFPALVKSNSTFHIGTSTGYDVHFQDLAGNELPFELDYYDSATGNGAWWVRIPSLSSSGSTTIKMIYGDSGASTNASSPSTIWSDYRYVYHFNDTTWRDSASGFVAYQSESARATADISLVSNSITGLGCRVHVTSGYGDYYWGRRIGEYTESSTATYSTLATSSVIPYGRTFDSGSGWNRYGFRISETGFQTYAGGAEITIPHTDLNGRYCYAGSTKPQEINWLVNGVSQDASSGSPGWFRWDSPNISGTGYSAAYPTELVLDELRISSTVCKSADWLQYEYNQAVNHSNYTTYSAEMV